MKSTEPLKWNQDVISIFSEGYYGSFLTKGNLMEEVVIEEMPFWLLHKNKKKYILQHDKEHFLPIIPVKFEKIKHRNKLLHNISEFKSAKFKQEKHWEFREFTEEFMNVKHSNPKDFLMYKFIVLASYLERTNTRTATQASFGKGGPVLVLDLLRKDVSLINPRSMAAVEYRLTNKLLVLDEISNLESSQRKLLQEFMLLAGDFKNVYEKSTRGSKSYGTSDSYKIPNLSLAITYNTLDHYQGVEKQEDKYFDKVFQKAARDRFLPVKLEGTIDVKQFIVLEDKKLLAEKYKPYYINFIRTIEYFKHNYKKELRERNIVEGNSFKWVVPSVGGLLTGRQAMTFDRIARFIALYSKDEKEFQDLCRYMLMKVKDYYIMLSSGNDTLTSTMVSDAPIKKETIPSITEEKIDMGNSGEKKEDNLIEEIEMLLVSGSKMTEKGYPMDEFIKFFTEEKMNELIKEGELIISSPGYIKRLK